MDGKTQQTAAAMAGMSERSARKWQCGPLPSKTRTERHWRTRPDPFDWVWEEEILPLLQGESAGRLRATTIIDWLEERHPGRFSGSQLRTLQRRLQALRQAQEACAERSGPGGLLPPGAPPRARGPDRLHPLQLPGGHHRRPFLPPPAVPVGAEPFRMALRRGGQRRDLPGPEAGTPERPVGAGRQPPGDPLGQHLSPDTRDKAQPRPVAERQLRRVPGPLWARVHPDQFRRVPRERRRRAGPLPPQGRHRPSPHAAGQPRLQLP